MATFERESTNWLDRQFREINEKEESQRNEAEMEFERLHHEGAERFGVLWLQANQIVAKVQHNSYVPQDKFGQTDIRVKALLSAAAWEVAEVLSGNQGKNDKYFTAVKLSPARYEVLRMLMRGGYFTGDSLKNSDGHTIKILAPAVLKWAKGIAEPKRTQIHSDGEQVEVDYWYISNRGRAVYHHQQRKFGD